MESDIKKLKDLLNINDTFVISNCLYEGKTIHILDKFEENNFVLFLRTQAQALLQKRHYI